ncbi:MAG TPA: hypothetical protein VK961_19315 [Chthoniobacter sp.]|nr:hypothetical protein [Chthoniobacter sp.]
MKRTLLAGLFFAAVALFLCTGSVQADEKVDISKVVTKSDAEKILGVAVKDAAGRNQQGKDGYYDSEWSYYATKGDKALVFDFLIGPPGLTTTMFSVLPPGGGKSTKVEGFGEKAIFYHDKTGLDMLNILKGNTLITIGIKGLPASGALEQEKALARKILAQM